MDTRHLNSDPAHDLPIHRLPFEDWVEACWARTRYRDAYIEDFGLEEARYAVVCAGGSIEGARHVYYKTLFRLPRHTDVALSVYDALPADLQTLATAHFDSLPSRLDWRRTVERALADGCRLWVRRDDLRSITRQAPLTLYRSAQQDTCPPGSTATLPFRRPGAALNARVSGRVLEHDGSLWIEGRYPDSRCITLERFLIAQPFAVMAPGARPEPPSSTALEAILPTDYFEVDERPGSVYYVTARQPSGSSALLLGPFRTHLEALAQTAVASAYVQHKARTATDMAVSIGTGRLEITGAPLPQGRINATLLDSEQLSCVAQLLIATPSEAAVASV